MFCLIPKSRLVYVAITGPRGYFYKIKKVIARGVPPQSEGMQHLLRWQNLKMPDDKNARTRA